MNPLVTTEELAAHPEWRIFDCRHDLAKPAWGLEEYEKAHIPGAIFAGLDRDLSAPKSGKNGRHPLPDAKSFIAWLGKQGLSQADPVVCYDSGPGSTAARLWWMLRWVRHPAVAVLDGGFSKWIAEQRPVTADVPSFAARAYEGKADRAMAVDVAFVERNLKKAVLLDARAPVRYRGEQEPIDPVAGRIPGALNRFNSDNVTAAGTFKPAEVLRQEFLAVLGDRSVSGAINYCGSGVSACHNLLAMEIAGLTGARLYAGSWSEWSAEPARPISRSV